MAEEKKSVKELSELVDGMGRLSVRANFIARGGLEVADLGQAVAALTQDMPAYQAAADGLGDLDDELKDVSGDEALVVLAKVLKWVKLSKRANQGENPDVLIAQA